MMLLTAVPATATATTMTTTHLTTYYLLLLLLLLLLLGKQETCRWPNIFGAAMAASCWPWS